MGNLISARKQNIIVPLDPSQPQEGTPLEGTGKYASQEGTTYIGEFHQGGFHGRGSFRYTDGAIYQGDWLAHNRHGKGQLQFITGETYNGDFLYDEIHGWGKLIYTSGDAYEGQFLFGCQNGIGTYTNAETKRVYQGQWFNNLFHGHGIYYHENGRRMYDGNWKSGLAHGFGVLYDTSGKRIYRGLWVDGVMAKAHSNSSITDSPLLTASSTAASSPALSAQAVEDNPYAQKPPETPEQKKTTRERLLLNPLAFVKHQNSFDTIFKPVSIADISDKIAFNPLRIGRANRPILPVQDIPPLSLEASHIYSAQPTVIRNPFSVFSDTNHPLSAVEERSDSSSSPPNEPKHQAD